MTLSDDRLEVRKPDRQVRHAGAIPSQPAPVLPPAGPADLGRYLRATQLLADADRLDVAYGHCGTAIDAAARWESWADLAAAYSLRSAVARRLGDLGPSLRDSLRADDLLATAGGHPRGDTAVLYVSRHIATLTDLGEYVRADGLLAARGLTGDAPDTDSGLGLLFVRARLHSAAGRPGEALPDLFRCGERLAARRSDRPTVLPWRSEAAIALHLTGVREAALRLAEAEVEMTRRSSTAAALARALRVKAVVAGLPEGLELLEEALRVLDRTPRLLDLAETMVDYGTMLNDARRRPPARRVLRTALELTERCGAPALMSRARSQFVTAGGRLRPQAAIGAAGLAAAERRAATLAAADRTNRQIAEELFLSVRTVEIHLTNAYRKLGISRRAELAAVLRPEPTGDVTP